MVQFIYSLFNSKVAKCIDNTGKCAAEVISKQEEIPIQDFYLCVNGQLLRKEDRIENNCTIQVLFRLNGGKGGYGNMLKKQAKKTNPNATLDFSACRDLNGRRMRFVNATVAMQKWKERLDRLEELKAENPNATLDDIPMDTPNAGIYGWYSAVPGWAEGVKRSRSAFMKDQKKQKMCERWWNAHKDGKVPPNADPHYGCPRRDQCDFAHGLDELTGEGRALFLRDLEREKQQKEQQKIDDYINYDSMAEEAMNAIDTGFQLKKKKKKIDKKRVLFIDDENDSFMSAIPSKKQATILSSSSSSQFASKLTVLTGKATIENDGIVYASSSFPSIRLGNEVIVTGCYYFEIHLVTNGLVQIGWCGKNHTCNEEEENGVGDDDNSWSFDVVREKTWHGDEGKKYGEVCQAGDIIGVCLDADKRTLSYSINGKDCGIAFTGVMAIGGMFPVISLEKDEAVLVNLGQFPFEYKPRDTVTAVWEFAKKL